jgi:putative nucleotidyltransferase with HDIG domain
MKPFKKLKRHFTLWIVLIIILPIIVLATISYINIYQQRYDYFRLQSTDEQTCNLLLTENLLNEKLELNNLQIDIMTFYEDEDQIDSALEKLSVIDQDVEVLLFYRLKDNQVHTKGSIQITKNDLVEMFSSNEKFYFDEEYVYVISHRDFNMMVRVYPSEHILGRLLNGTLEKKLYYGDQVVFSTNHSENSDDYAEWLMLTGLDSRFKLSIRFSWLDFLVLHKDMLIETITYSLLSILLMILISRYFVMREFGSFETIQESINRLLKGNYSIRVPEKGTVEQREIIEVFNQMAEQIEERMSDHTYHLNEMLEHNRQLNEASHLLNQSIYEIERSKEELTWLREKNEIVINKFDQLLIRFDELGFITYINEYGMNKLGIDDYSELSMQNVIKYRYNLDVFSNLVDFLIKYEVNQIQLEFMNFKTHYSDTLLVSNKHLVHPDGHKEVQLIGKELSMEYVVEKNLKQTKIEYAILDDINFDNLKFDQIESYFHKITRNLYQLLDPVEVSIIHIEDERIKTMKFTSKIENYRKLDGKSIENSVFEQVVNHKEPIEIRSHHQSVVQFNDYYDMHTVADLFNQVYLHPLVIDKKVTDMILIISDHLYPKNHIEVAQTIINHLNLAIERVRLIESLKESGTKMIRTLTRTIEAKDRYTVGHSERVAEISRHIAKKMGYNSDFVEEIYLAGLLHDIGKLAIEDQILTKEGRLIEAEYDRIKEHPTAGFKILDNAAFSKNVSDTARFHHKRYDLTGYPEDESEALGPMPAIVGVADALDAIMTDRSYRLGQDIDYAIQELEKFSGTQFDPAVVTVAIEEMRRNRLYFEELLSDGGQHELSSIIPQI